MNVAKAVLIAWKGPPPSPQHTADHLDRNPKNNSIHNLDWATPTQQANNRTPPETRTHYQNIDVRAKAISQFTLEGELVQTYPSVAEVFRVNNFPLGGTRTQFLQALQSNAVFKGFKWSPAVLSVTNLDNEEWRPITQDEAQISVSSEGRFKHLRQDGCSEELMHSPQTGHPVFSTECGYYQYTLNTGKGAPKYMKVHQWVMSLFGPPKPASRADEIYTIDHEDRDPLNNAIRNLAWKTLAQQAANQSHRIGTA